MLNLILWLKGMLFHRSGRMFGAMTGIALTVALLSSVGIFITSSLNTMTKRAVTNVPVDWQILLNPQTDIGKAKSTIHDSINITALETVGYADTAGFIAQTGGSTQTTGAGKVLGIDSSYREHFPAEFRSLIGSLDGVVVAQQTAANLHVTMGDTITIQRMGLPPVKVRVAGIADLPNADSMFQAIGASAGSAPQAPPDNVLILPSRLWHSIFDAQAQMHPDSVHTQLHVKLAHNDLPSNPQDAYTTVHQRANHALALLSGNGFIGDNLAARLDGVRTDGLYAEVLFLFLGLPGVILAVLLTVSVAASGKTRRRQELALLKIRGATSAKILSFELVEALLIGIGGSLFGAFLTYVACHFVAAIPLAFDPTTGLWMISSAGVGLAVAIFSILYPAWKESRFSTAAGSRAIIGHGRKSLWQRVYLDIILLVVFAGIYWGTTTKGYQLVLAPEGVAETAVHYEAFIAPLCLWIGGTLLFMRLFSIGLVRGHNVLTRLFGPIAKNLAGVSSASLIRQRALITRGVALVALAFSFAISTAVFNTTYNVQSRVDAELTNGADVAVSGSHPHAPSSKLAELRALPGIAAIEPMMHRFAYVGNDLQDLYGIHPQRIDRATDLSNAYFANGNAKQTMAALAKQPDGVLISDETAHDFQLQPGDLINLRLQNTNDHQYHVIPFHFVGIAKEFPTAPKDSFLVANADYIAKQTGSNASETLLIRSRGNPAHLAKEVSNMLHSLPGVKVTDIDSVQQKISSSLTAVDLQGLTRLELLFAVLFAAGGTGLVLSLEWTERRRSFSILLALGAKRNQLAAFLWSEGLLILCGGGLIGVPLGFSIAEILVQVLTGVFDPPPESLFVPWGYLLGLSLASIFSMVFAVLSIRRISHRHAVASLRQL